MRCPVCDGALERVAVRDIGGVTADLFWQVHTGQCPEHGWFQAEVVSTPPREIFGVDRPFGVARRLIVEGQETYGFTTVWGALPLAQRLAVQPDPLDGRYWRVAPGSGLAAATPGPIRREG